MPTFRAREDQDRKRLVTELPFSSLFPCVVGTSTLGRAMQPTPRKLTTHQKAVLIQVLLAFPDQQVGVCCHPLATDVLSYAKDFPTVFKVTGWNVNERAPSEPSSVNARAGRLW